jgi:hypothetical protein
MANGSSSDSEPEEDSHCVVEYLKLLAAESTEAPCY